MTVVKDAPTDLERTVGSVAGQDLDGVEYVVVDSSADVERSRAVLADVPHRYTWTEARGIYAAMNSALQEATGEYVYFANAGDLLRDGTLSRVRVELNRAHPVWAFGEVEIVHRDGSRVVTPRWDYGKEKGAGFSRGHFPPHQGTFAGRAALMSTGGFDETFSIVADYVAFLRLSQLADPLYLDFVVATFAEGGLSTTSWRESVAQLHRARREVLQFRGRASVREYANTAWQLASMSLYRDVWSRVARR